jgi:hypothetical protein
MNVNYLTVSLHIKMNGELKTVRTLVMLSVNNHTNVLNVQML